MGSGYIVQRGGGKDYSTFKALVDDTLTEVTPEMVEGCTKFSSYIFADCTELTNISIPQSVTIIEQYAFYNCSSLSSATIEATTPPKVSGNIFPGTSENLVIYVPAGSVDTYKAASGWSDYASRIQAIPST